MSLYVFLELDEDTILLIRLSQSSKTGLVESRWILDLSCEGLTCSRFTES